MNDTISTEKIPSENTRRRLVFSLGIFLVEMMSFMFLSQHKDSQAIFYFVKWLVPDDLTRQGESSRCERVIN